MQPELTNTYLDQIQNAFNKHDVDEILSYFSDNCIWIMAKGPHSPDGRTCVGKNEIGDTLNARYKEIPDMRWEDIRHWTFDQTKAISEWIVRGSPIDKEPFSYLGCDLWEFKDGLVTKKDTYWKMIE